MFIFSLFVFLFFKQKKKKCCFFNIYIYMKKFTLSSKTSDDPLLRCRKCLVTFILLTEFLIFELNGNYVETQKCAALRKGNNSNTKMDFSMLFQKYFILAKWKCYQILGKSFKYSLPLNYVFFTYLSLKIHLQNCLLVNKATRS